MHIERRHNLGKEEAIHKIDTFLEDLMRRQFPGEVAIKDASKNWSDGAVRFSFKAIAQVASRFQCRLTA